MDFMMVINKIADINIWTKILIISVLVKCHF